MLRLKGWNSVQNIEMREGLVQDVLIRGKRWKSKWDRKTGRELTCSCCCRASSICCRCFSICEAASFFCSSWAARSCSLRLISCVIIVESCLSFSARLSGVPGHGNKMPAVTQTCTHEENLMAVWKQKKDYSVFQLAAFTRDASRSKRTTAEGN